MRLSADGRAMLLLCTGLGLTDDAETRPFTLREWNSLAGRLLDSSLGRPGELLGLPAETLERELSLPQDKAIRVVRLTGRGEALSWELDRLESLGIWALTRADAQYPARLKRRLKHRAPAVLFGAGEPALLGQPGLAVVGSRQVDEQGHGYADFIGNACAHDGLVLYSGGARGVDQIATAAALEARGTAVSVLPHGLEKALRAPEARSRLDSGDLALISPYLPHAGFSVGAAMGRNKLIYGLADYALIVASDAGKGGTWGGATEALRAKWLPVFVLDGPEVPEGNRQLMQKGARPLPAALLAPALALREWLGAHTEKHTPPLLLQARLL